MKITIGKLVLIILMITLTISSVLFIGIYGNPFTSNQNGMWEFTSILTIIAYTLYVLSYCCLFIIDSNILNKKITIRNNDRIKRKI